jgi:hypothetical protein
LQESERGIQKEKEKADEQIEMTSTGRKPEPDVPHSRALLP